MSTDVHETETTPEPQVDPWDAALDQSGESPQPDRARDDQGRFASTPEPETAPETEAQPAAPETPAEAAERRALKVKLDHQEKEIDLDALWATEEGRKELRERYEKGYGFDRAVERAKQESFTTGREATLKWLAAQGYRVRANPAVDGGWEIVGPQAATPAPASPASAATPTPAQPTRQELEHLATYGDENDPAGQIKAIRALAKMDAEEAASAKFRAFEEWRAQQTRQAQEAQAASARAQAEAHVKSQIQAALEARAKSFDGPDRERQVARIAALAMAKARTDAQHIDDVIAVVHEAANDLDQRRDYFLKQAAKPAETRSPPPSLDGVPSSTAATKKPGGERLTGWNDPRLDEILGG